MKSYILKVNTKIFHKKNLFFRKLMLFLDYKMSKICNLFTLANYTGTNTHLKESELLFLYLCYLYSFFKVPVTCEQAKWLSDCLISQCAEKSAPIGARTRILGLAVDDSSRSATTPKKNKKNISV